MLRNGKEINNKIGDKEDKRVEYKKTVGEEEPLVLHKRKDAYIPPWVRKEKAYDEHIEAKAPYPTKLKGKEEKSNQEFLSKYQMLSQLKVTLPLLEVVESIPSAVSEFRIKK